MRATELRHTPTCCNCTLPGQTYLVLSSVAADGVATFRGLILRPRHFTTESQLSSGKSVSKLSLTVLATELRQSRINSFGILRDPASVGEVEPHPASGLAKRHRRFSPRHVDKYTLSFEDYLDNREYGGYALRVLRLGI